MLPCSWLLATALSFGFLAQNNAPAPQTIDPAFRSDIVRLLEVTGSANIGVQVANTMLEPLLNSVRQAQPDLPDRAIAIVKEVVQAELKNAVEAPDGLMAQIVNIYAAHFTPDDVRGLLAFYGSDLGRKVTATLPVLTRESMQAGQEWGMRIGPRIEQSVQERLKKEGFIK
jgi:hypothetical protein